MRAGRLHVRVHWGGALEQHRSAGYSACRELVLKLLSDSLATEIVCLLRYWRHQFMARGIAERLRRVRSPSYSTERLVPHTGRFSLRQLRFRVKDCEAHAWTFMNPLGLSN
jgi:hypothetical protein